MIDAHRGAFEYDWRARLHSPLSEVGRSMSWGEAIRQTVILASDPGTRIGAAIAGWDRPYTLEELALLNVFDSLEIARLGKKSTRAPRPWDQRPKHLGTPMSASRFRAIVAAHAADSRTKEATHG